MAEIILDKSYLDGASPQEIKSLCRNHRVFMPDVLFYELITSRKTSMQRCFNKFPDTINPVELIPNVGTLLRYEIDNQRPCTPLYDRREKSFFSFNRGLSTGAYEFGALEMNARKEQEDVVERKTKDFFELAMMVPVFFQELCHAPKAGLPNKIQALKERVASDKSTVRRFYATLLEKNNIANPIHPDTLDTNWAYFRWVQVRCLYSLDLMFRYNGCMPADPKANFWENIEHDMLDSEYVILASLSGGFACNEKRMIAFFRMIRPDGLCFNK